MDLRYSGEDEAFRAQVRAWLDRDSIRMGETVTLNVETDARGGSEPDFSALDQNFRRLGTSSNTQLSFVNGRQSARTLWAVALEPLHEGVIGIPAFAVGSESTTPLSSAAACSSKSKLRQNRLRRARPQALLIRAPKGA